jgi:preprotein translocase subunit SecG
MDLLLLRVHFAMQVLAALWVLCAVILVLVILIQKGRGVGLSGALGGGAAGGILGTKTGDFLTWVTVGMVGVFLLLSIALARFYRPMVTTVPEEPRQVGVQSQPIEQETIPQPQAQTNLPAGEQAAPESAPVGIGVTDQNQTGNEDISESEY